MGPGSPGLGCSAQVDRLSLAQGYGGPNEGGALARPEFMRALRPGRGASSGGMHRQYVITEGWGGQSLRRSGSTKGLAAGYRARTRDGRGPRSWPASAELPWAGGRQRAQRQDPGAGGVNQTAIQWRKLACPDQTTASPIWSGQPR